MRVELRERFGSHGTIDYFRKSIKVPAWAVSRSGDRLADAIFFGSIYHGEGFKWA